MAFWDLGGHFPYQKVGSFAVGAGGICVLCWFGVPYYSSSAESPFAHSGFGEDVELVRVKWTKKTHDIIFHTLTGPQLFFPSINH